MLRSFILIALIYSVNSFARLSGPPELKCVNEDNPADQFNIYKTDAKHYTLVDQGHSIDLVGEVDYSTGEVSLKTTEDGYYKGQIWGEGIPNSKIYPLLKYEMNLLSDYEEYLGAYNKNIIVTCFVP